MTGFFGPKDPEVQRRQDEAAARHDADLRAVGDAMEALICEAECDRDAARLIMLAQLLDPAAFDTRESLLEGVRRMRSGPRGNDPDFATAIVAHERTARAAIRGAVSKARQVLELVRSWD